MTPFIAYLITVAVGLLVVVAMVEISDLREKDRRDEARRLQRARDVTGRVQ